MTDVPRATNDPPEPESAGKPEHDNAAAVNAALVERCKATADRIRKNNVPLPQFGYNGPPLPPD